MSGSKDRAPRDRRRRAAKAVAEAKRAEAQTQKLARSLSREARASLQTVAASVHAQISAARDDVDRRPRRAARRARKASARLERASLRATASAGARDVNGAGGANRTHDPKKRAKTIKRRRTQAKQAHKMAKFVAVRTLAAAIVAPTDEEQRENDAKRAPAKPVPARSIRRR